MFLGRIKDAFDRNPELQNLLLDDFFKSAVENCQVCSPEPLARGPSGWASLWGIRFPPRSLGRVEICHFDGASYLSGGLCSRQESWRRAVSTGVQAGIPMPCFTTALSFYDGYRHEMLPANLIQVRTREAVAGRAPGVRASAVP